MSTPSIILVASVVVRYDAISLAVRDTYFALKQWGYSDVVVFAGRCEFEDMTAVEVGDVTQLLTAPAFLDADLILYHFGIYHPLFDAMLIGNGRAKQAVFYHNITPIALVAPSVRKVIEHSHVQVFNLSRADRLWPVSAFNADCLRELGFEPEKIDVIPLVVEKPPLRSPLMKSKTGLEILFIGRAVPSKGLMDALEAFAALHQESPDTRLRVACHFGHSDAAYLEKCRNFIVENKLDDAVAIVESPDDAKLCDLYAAAHILLLPTSHEGFCVPVVEALRAGAITVGYAAGNMSHVCEGLGRLVAVGDKALLAEALNLVKKDLCMAHAAPDSHRIQLDRGEMTMAELEGAAWLAVQKYRFEEVSKSIAKHVERLLKP